MSKESLPSNHFVYASALICLCLFNVSHFIPEENADSVIAGAESLL